MHPLLATLGSTEARPRRTQTWSIAALCLAALSIVGCAGTVSGSAGVVYGDPVVYVDPPPAYVYSSPVYYYRGYPAYWVDNRWYYQSSAGWVVFRREPRVLYQARVRAPARVYNAPRRPHQVHVHPRATPAPRAHIVKPNPRVDVRPRPEVRSRVQVRGEGHATIRSRRDRR